MSTTCRERHRPAPPHQGFTLVSMLFVLVVLAALGAALANMSMRQHMGSAAELAAARAVQAARAGVEWAAFQVLRSPGPAGVAPACFASTSFALAGLSDFTVTVNCTRTPGTGTVSDGASNLVFFELVATACNAPSGGTCPSTASLSETYVERQLSWTVMR